MRSVLKYLLSTGVKPFVSSSQPSFEKEDCSFFAQNGVEFEAGCHSFERLKKSELIVISPGVPLTIYPFSELPKCGIEIIGDIELFYRIFPHKKYLAVTGSNGKTTTVTLLYHLLKKEISVELCGNVGIPIFDFADSERELFLIELSSFQIETLSQIRFEQIFFTNLQPDHLNRYDSLEDYYNAKLRLLNHQKSGCLVTINRDCGELMARLPFFRQSTENLCLVGNISEKVSMGESSENPEHPEIKRDGEYSKKTDMLCKIDRDSNIVIVTTSIVTRGTRTTRLSTANFHLVGEHNLYNLAFGIVSSLRLGLTRKSIEARLSTFRPMEHRLELFHTHEGVKFINDSKATSLSASLSGINSLDGPLILICGGVYKGDDFDPWLQSLPKKVKKIILIGESTELFKERLSQNKTPWESFLSLEQACTESLRLSISGDTVVLSPGCASFDMFKDFEERGRKFKEDILTLTTGS